MFNLRFQISGTGGNLYFRRKCVYNTRKNSAENGHHKINEEVRFLRRNRGKRKAIMKPSMIELLYIGEYIAAAVIAVLFALKNGRWSTKTEIDRHTFLRYLMVTAVLLCFGIAIMTGLYMLPMQDGWKSCSVGAVRSLMTTGCYAFLGSAVFRRYKVYPRGKELALVLFLLYAVADLFMAGTMVKYVILAVTAAGGFLIPDRWKT